MKLFLLVGGFASQMCVGEKSTTKGQAEKRLNHSLDVGSIRSRRVEWVIEAPTDDVGIRLNLSEAGSANGFDGGNGHRSLESLGVFLSGFGYNDVDETEHPAAVLAAPGRYEQRIA
jgi:hypothetical protein